MKKIMAAVILAICLSMAAGCGSSEGDGANSAEPPVQEPAGGTENNGEQGAGTDAPRLDLPRLEEALATILDGCTEDLTGGYPVDEEFLGWVHGKYGAGALYDLADAVEKDQQDMELWHSLTGSSLHALWSGYCRDMGFRGRGGERVYWKECADEKATALSFVGDVNFSEGWSTILYLDQQVDGIFDCLSQETMAELRGADILVVNNEFTYSLRGEPLEGKDYVFRADPDRVYLMELLGADLASLANNHVYDYGEEALLDTMETLRNAGIPYVGAGKDLEEAMKPCYFVANGRKIAIVAATQVERTYSFTKEATEDSPGVLKTLEPDKFLTVIQEAEENADYVIVYVHWGTEQKAYFEADQTSLARAYVKAGADVIVGAHPHCLQGAQYLDGTPVIYSLGNFWFNSNKLDTGIFQVRIYQDGTIKCRFVPCIQKKNTTAIAQGEDWTRILDYMETISSGVSFDEEGYLSPAE